MLRDISLWREFSDTTGAAELAPHLESFLDMHPYEFEVRGYGIVHDINKHVLCKRGLIRDDLVHKFLRQSIIRPSFWLFSDRSLAERAEYIMCDIPPESEFRLDLIESLLEFHMANESALLDLPDDWSIVKDLIIFWCKNQEIYLLHHIHLCRS